jgi:tricorn protease
MKGELHLFLVDFQREVYMSKILRFFLTVLLFTGIGLAADQAASVKVPDALMLRFPDISGDRIVFVYAGDIWTAPKDGGLARHLSSPEGHEQFPKFSPDGRWIAFSGNYDGNVDVYLMPAEGGTPKRLTHHPDAEVVVDWYPDGEHILYRSRMFSPSRRFNRFFKQSIRGGMSQVLPLPYGELGCLSPDGGRIAFQFTNRQFRTWKRYRGGMAGDIWLYDFAKNFSEKITDFEGTDAVPMWHGDTIYILSDRDEKQKLNIWAYDLNTKQTRQVTKFVKYDVKWPSLGPDAIIFENGGKLYLLDLADEKVRPVSIQVPADLPDVRPQFKNLSKYIVYGGISPSGKRALFEARGEILTIPAEHGSIRNLTATSGVAERYPAWSPDGKWIAYFSDKTGEYQFYIQRSDGKGKSRMIKFEEPSFYYVPVWSPDSKKIACNDKAGNLFVVDVSDEKWRKVDKDDWNRITSYSWSPDSRWLAYSKSSENYNRVIMIYDSVSDKKHQATSDYYTDFQPVFDPEGKYLYFYSNRTFRPIYSDYDSTWIYPDGSYVYVATLRKEVESPFAPRSDEEKITEEKEEKEKEEKKAEKKEEEKTPKPVRIDFVDFEKRVTKVPAEAMNVGPLHAVKGKVIFLRYPPSGAAKPNTPSGTLVYYDFDKREEKTVISGIDTYDISADGKKVIYKSKNTYGIVDLAPGKKVGDGKIAVAKMKAWVDLRKEWRQIFNEAWRVERDFFYDPDMHGLDWLGIKKRYGALLPYVVNREDLNYVIGEMIAELNASHSYVGGGDIEQAKRISVGLLGCDFDLDEPNNAYRIKKIYEGASWDVEVRSPLREPGVVVNEGDYLLAVNGQPIDTTKDPWAAFQGLAGEVVSLTTNSSPSMDGTREVLVKPLRSEFRLRNLAWIENNRQKVERATNGRVGYIYVPDTSLNGQNELVRQFGSQINKDGLIIDERFNSGGQIPDRFIEKLNRPIYNYWARRDHNSWRTPFFAHDGPKVMLINQWAGSGGDAFPYYFRKAGLGPLVGKRTWGGLIGMSGNPLPIDGGFVSAPSFGFWNVQGQWEVEGYGVDPDYDLENEPHEMVVGRDQQLEKAIQVTLDLLEKNPPKKLKKPEYPNKTPKIKR